MPKTEAKKRADAKYDAKHFKTLGLRVKIEEAEKITTHANSYGESVHAFLMRAVAEQMQRDGAGNPFEPRARQSADASVDGKDPVDP